MAEVDFPKRKSPVSGLFPFWEITSHSKIQIHVVLTLIWIRKKTTKKHSTFGWDINIMHDMAECTDDHWHWDGDVCCSWTCKRVGMYVKWHILRLITCCRLIQELLKNNDLHGVMWQSCDLLVEFQIRKNHHLQDFLYTSSSSAQKS